MAETAVASIEDIPVELMIQILSNAPNLATLHKLTVASPHAFRVFNKHGMSFLDQVVKNETPPEILCLIRLVVQVRASTTQTSPAPTLKEFTESYTDCLDEDGETHTSYTQIGDSGTLKQLEPSAGTPLHKIQQPSADIGYSARQIVLLIRKVSLMTEACITYFHRKCRFVKQVVSNHHLTDYLTPGWRDCHVHYGPPSWLETQRAARGFWRLILYHDLEAAARSGRLGWNPNDVSKVYNSTANEFYECWYSQQWEIQSVQQFLGDKGLRPLNILFNPINASIIPSFITGNESSQRKSVRSLSELPLVLRQQPKHDSSDRIGVFAHGYYYTEILGEPSEEVEYAPYCSLGLAFWDKRRLQAMGLITEASPDAQSLQRMTVLSAVNW